MSEKIAIKYNEKNICRLPVLQTMGGKYEDIIVGINYIDAEYWEEAKKHDSVKRKLESGMIQEIKTTEKKKEIEVEEIKKEKDKDGKEIEKKVKVKKEQVIKVTDWKNFSTEEKKNVIEKEIFSIKTLEEFLKREKEADIRYLIEKRIDAIKNATKDETIGHPDSHLKL